MTRSCDIISCLSLNLNVTHSNLHTQISIHHNLPHPSAHSIFMASSRLAPFTSRIRLPTRRYKYSLPNEVSPPCRSPP